MNLKILLNNSQLFAKVNNKNLSVSSKMTLVSVKYIHLQYQQTIIWCDLFFGNLSSPIKTFTKSQPKKWKTNTFANHWNLYWTKFSFFLDIFQFLRNITIQVLLSLNSFKIILFDQNVNAFLNKRDFRFKSSLKLCNNLRN